jgi:hypothetical protein
VAKRRRGSSRIPFGIWGGLFLLAVLFWLVAMAVRYWYLTLVIVALIGGVVWWWRDSQRRQEQRQRDEWDAQWEANRQAWRDLVWDDGPYSVIVSAIPDSDNEGQVYVLLSDTPAFRDLPDPEQAADEVVERIAHIAPQVVAEGISQSNAIHLKEALVSRGAKVKITETVRVAARGARREPIPESVRHEVWRRDGGQCVDCGSRDRLEYDHIIAVANGGSNTARNIELRCQTCNRKKGAKV